jgi:hypothetical protein
MRLIGTLTAVAVLLAIVGCAGSGGVVPIGKDTYMVSGTGYISGGSVVADLYREAGQFCAGRQRELQPIYETSKDAAAYTYASAEIHFRCLAEDDPELRRPTLEPSANVRVRIDK